LVDGASAASGEAKWRGSLVVVGIPNPPLAIIRDKSRANSLRLGLRNLRRQVRLKGKQASIWKGCATCAAVPSSGPLKISMSPQYDKASVGSPSKNQKAYEDRPHAARTARHLPAGEMGSGTYESAIFA
jgi:hypothetical protein